MRKFRGWLVRVGGLFNKSRKDRELSDEIESHLQMHIEENLRQGMPAEEARRRAQLQLGGIEATKEAYRDQRGVPFLESLLRDARFSLRQLLKNPGFTVVAILSLSLGIGVCTAVFSLVNAILLRSLPVPNPQELRVVQWTGVDTRMRSISGHFEVNGNQTVAECVSVPLFQTLREKGAAWADIFAFAPLDNVVVHGSKHAFAGNGMVVSDNFFTALKLSPIIGNVFNAGGKELSDTHHVVITFDWWAKHFGNDPSVLGQSVSLNGSKFTIIGVLPRGFAGVRPGDPRGFFVPLTEQSPFLERAVSSPEHWWVRLMARMHQANADGQLKAALDVEFSREAQSQMKEPQMVVQPGRGGLAFDRNNYGKPLLLMLAAVGLVMLVACANLAGLSLARGAARQHELALRAALGAGRWRLVLQSFVESLVLALLGGILGILFAIWGRTAISQLLAGSSDGLQYDFSLDVKVLGFALAAALVTALLSGLLPALRAGQSDPLNGLRSRNSLSMPRLRAGRSLVIAQIGLSLLLLSGAGLYLRTLANLQDIDVGFEREKLLIFQISPSAAGYKEGDLAGYYDRVQDAISVLPGAKSAAIMVFPLLDNKSSSGGFNFVEGGGNNPGSLETFRMVVSETFFNTMGIPMLRGRALSAADTDSAPKNIVVNETFVRRYYPNEEPIGKSISTWRNNWRIVGVCADAKYQNIKESIPPTIYISHRQFPLRFGAYFVVRTLQEPQALASAVRRAVAAIDPGVPVALMTTQNELVDRTIGKERLFAVLCGGLAGFALLLSCIGLYGLMAFNVTRRTGEIGIRMAIGARPGDVARTIVKEALVLAAGGIAIGLPAVFAVTRLIRSQLYGVQPYDPATLVVVIVTLVTVSFVAAWLPAWRAARIDPMKALRCD